MRSGNAEAGKWDVVAQVRHPNYGILCTVQDIPLQVQLDTTGGKQEGKGYEDRGSHGVLCAKIRFFKEIHCENSKGF